MMRTLSPELIKTLVTHFSFGAISHFDPAVAKGSQRESWHDLGFGWIYWALARVTEPLKVLVVGSGRGFSAVCLGLGIEQRPKAEVLLVDPGYRLWAVENTQDAAEGYWESEQQATQHFARHLDLSNIKLLRMRSDEAFHRLQNEGQRFDLVMIDGEHSYSQVLTDLRNAEQCLNTGGIILAHDTVCPQWPWRSRPSHWSLPGWNVCRSPFFPVYR